MKTKKSQISFSATQVVTERIQALAEKAGYSTSSIILSAIQFAFANGLEKSVLMGSVSKQPAPAKDLPLMEPAPAKAPAQKQRNPDNLEYMLRTVEDITDPEIQKTLRALIPALHVPDDVVMEQLEKFLKNQREREELGL